MCCTAPRGADTGATRTAPALAALAGGGAGLHPSVSLLVSGVTQRGDGAGELPLTPGGLGSGRPATAHGFGDAEDAEEAMFSTGGSWGAPSSYGADGTGCWRSRFWFPMAPSATPTRQTAKEDAKESVAAITEQMAAMGGGGGAEGAAEAAQRIAPMGPYETLSKEMKHFDVILNWDDGKVVDTSAFSPHLGFSRMLYSRSRAPGGMPLGVDPPPTPYDPASGDKAAGAEAAASKLPRVGLLPQAPADAERDAWLRYSSANQGAVDVNELADWVMSVAPRQVSDLKPMLMLTQGVLRDLVHGRLETYSRQVSDLRMALFEQQRIAMEHTRSLEEALAELQAQNATMQQRAVLSKFRNIVKDVRTSSADMVAHSQEMERLKEELVRREADLHREAAEEKERSTNASRNIHELRTANAQQREQIELLRAELLNTREDAEAEKLKRDLRIQELAVTVDVMNEAEMSSQGGIASSDSFAPWALSAGGAQVHVHASMMLLPAEKVLPTLMAMPPMEAGVYLDALGTAKAAEFLRGIDRPQRAYLLRCTFPDVAADILNKLIKGVGVDLEVTEAEAMSSVEERLAHAAWLVLQMPQYFAGMLLSRMESKVAADVLARVGRRSGDYQEALRLVKDAQGALATGGDAELAVDALSVMDLRAGAWVLARASCDRVARALAELFRQGSLGQLRANQLLSRVAATASQLQFKSQDIALEAACQQATNDLTTAETWSALATRARELVRTLHEGHGLVCRVSRVTDHSAMAAFYTPEERRAAGIIQAWMRGAAARRQLRAARAAGQLNGGAERGGAAGGGAEREERSFMRAFGALATLGADVAMGVAPLETIASSSDFHGTDELKLLDGVVAAVRKREPVRVAGAMHVPVVGVDGMCSLVVSAPALSPDHEAEDPTAALPVLPPRDGQSYCKVARMVATLQPATERVARGAAARLAKGEALLAAGRYPQVETRIEGEALIAALQTVREHAAHRLYTPQSLASVERMRNFILAPDAVVKCALCALMLLGERFDDFLNSDLTLPPNETFHSLWGYLRPFLCLDRRRAMQCMAQRMLQLPPRATLGAKSALADACQGLCIEVSVESAARQGMALELMRTWSGAVLLQRTIAMQMRELP